MTAQTPADVLAEPVGEGIRVSEGLSGFGGLHGGLALALLASAMGDLVDGRVFCIATAQFLRPVRNEAAVHAWVLRHGRVMSATEATAGIGDEVQVHSVRAVGNRRRHRSEHVRPDRSGRPPARPLPPCSPSRLRSCPSVSTSRCDRWPARPFAGGPTAELVAWIRLVADDQPPDELRMVTLIDALAPSYTAVMTAPAPVPTTEITVRPGVALRLASSPWVLVPSGHR